MCCRLQGDTDSALHHLGEALALQLRIYGSESAHPDIIRTITATAETYAGRKEFGEAESICNQAIALGKKTFQIELDPLLTEQQREQQQEKGHPKIHQLYALLDRIKHGISTAPAPTVNRRPWHRLLTAHFVGREVELDRLFDKMNATDADGGVDSSPGRAVIVSETEGIGKTQLMLRYCFDHRHSYVHGIYWIDATTQARMHHSVVTVLLALGVKRSAVQELHTHAQVANALFAKLARLGTNWLLCFDGLSLGASKTMAIFKESYILDEEPRKISGHMMITSCDSDPDVWHRVEMGSPLELGPLSKEDGMLLLLRGALGIVRTNRTGLRLRCEGLSSDERHALKHVSKSAAHGLGGHPLAIVLAGAYLFGQGMKCGSFVSFREELRGLLRQAYLNRKEAATVNGLNSLNGSRPGSPVKPDAVGVTTGGASAAVVPLDVRVPVVMDVVVALNWELLSDPAANVLLALTALGPTDVSVEVVADVLSNRNLHERCNALDLGGAARGGIASSPSSRVAAWASAVVEATEEFKSEQSAKEEAQEGNAAAATATAGGVGASPSASASASLPPLLMMLVLMPAVMLAMTRVLHRLKGCLSRPMVVKEANLTARLELRRSKNRGRPQISMGACSENCLT